MPAHLRRPGLPKASPELTRRGRLFGAAGLFRVLQGSGEKLWRIFRRHVAAAVACGAPAPEDTPELFAGTLEHAEQSSRAKETATAGELPVMSSEVLAFADELAIPAAEPPSPVEAPHFQWMDEVLDEMEVEAAKSASAHDEPRSSALLDDVALPEFEPTPVAPSEGPPRYLLMSPAPPVPSPARIRLKEPRSGNWRIVVAYAAAAVFAAVVLLQWRSYRNQTDDGPIEIIERRIQAWMPDNEEDANSEQPGTATDSGASASTPSPQTEQPPQPQNQSPAEKTQPPKPGPVAASPLQSQQPEADCSIVRRAVCPICCGKAQATSARRARPGAGGCHQPLGPGHSRDG